MAFSLKKHLSTFPARSTATSNEGRRWGLNPVSAIRLAAAAAAVIAAILVMIMGANSEDVNRVSFATEISQARANQTINESTADSAPQQQVVNGWATVDMIEVLAKQNDASTKLVADVNAARDDRPTTLLFIGLLLGAVMCATSRPLIRRPVRETAANELPTT